MAHKMGDDSRSGNWILKEREYRSVECAENRSEKRSEVVPDGWMHCLEIVESV